MKRPASTRRAALPREVQYAKSFRQDWERLDRAGRLDLNRLKEAMRLLFMNDAPLGAEWVDHPLKGNRAGHRECHIGGDFLLVYQIVPSGKVDLVTFIRAGTHADLFDE